MGELDRAAVLAALREAAEFAASDASLRQIYAVIGALCLSRSGDSKPLRSPKAGAPGCRAPGVSRGKEGGGGPGEKRTTPFLIFQFVTLLGYRLASLLPSEAPNHELKRAC